MAFKMSYALLIGLATLLAGFPLAFGLYIMGDGGFGDRLLIHLMSADSVHHLLGTRQLGQGAIPTPCDSICNPVTVALNSVSAPGPRPHREHALMWNDIDLYRNVMLHVFI